MKLTVNTTQLQAMLNKAVKGAGFDKTTPVTCLIAISLKDGKLTLMTNDQSNYLYITASDISGDDFYVSVNADILTKLVAKLTSEKTTLEVDGAKLRVTGDGSYDIAMELDDDGNVNVIPDPSENFNGTLVGKIENAELFNILLGMKSTLMPVNKAAAEDLCYTCFFVGEKVMASDRYTVSSYAKGFLETPMLIGADTMNLAGLLGGTIAVFTSDTHMMFKGTNGAVYAPIPQWLSGYDFAGLNAFVEQDFDYSCKVSRNAMLSLLDRIALFVGAYENGKVTLSFTPDGLEVSSKYAEETVRYAEQGNVGNFTCDTDIDTLLEQFKAQAGDTVEIQYGNENTIKLVCGDVTAVVALLGE